MEELRENAASPLPRRLLVSSFSQNDSLVAPLSDGLAFYTTSLRLSARLVFLRHERLLEELSRGEGPLVSE
jgi:hypothetical protein